MLHWMRKNLAFAVALSAAVALAGCSDKKPAPAGKVGSAKVMLTAAELAGLDHVKLSITGGAAPITQNLTKVDDTHYSATVNDIPVGTYTFTANAYADAAEAHLALTGHADNVAIVAGQTAQVTIVLRDPTKPDDVMKRLPIIDGLSASAVTVQAGAVANVSVTAHSPENHDLAYLWQDSCEGGAHGTFATPAAAASSWTAPSSAGACQLSVRIGDATNETSVTAYLVITVTAPGTGSANVSAVVDTYPMVTVGSADAVIVAANPPAGLEVGITAHVVATASDADGSLVSITWSSNCGGTFSPSNTAATVDFHAADPNAACTLTAVISDSSTPANSVNALVVLTGASLCAGVTCPVSDACHVAGTCNPGTGTCSAETAVACPAGQACSIADGQCHPIDLCANVTCPAASDACHVAGTCNSATGTCSPETAVACPADQACSVSDGQCHPINLCANVTCPVASDACHVAGTCDPATGTCSAETAVACPAGQECRISDGQCHAIDLCAGVTCPAASDACHVAGTCNPATGTCSAETAVACPADQACSVSDGQCHPINLCANVTCPAASDACHVAGTCDPATGTCSAETAVSCPAGQECRISDGQCHAIDLCAGVTCPAASDLCHVAGTCNSATGSCSVETAVVCPEGQTCSLTDGQCHAPPATNPVAKPIALSRIDAVAMDADGATYITGPLFTPTKDFDGIPVTGAGSSDMFLAKYDPVTHNAVWARAYGDSGTQMSAGAAVTQDGTVAAIGSFDGTLNTVTDPQTYGIDFLMGVDSATGNVKWTNMINDGISGVLVSVAANPSRNIIAVCGYSSQASDMVTPTPTYGGGTRDAVIAAFDSSGAKLWAHEFGGANAEMCSAVAVDANGDVYAVGRYNGAMDLGLGALPDPGGLTVVNWLWVAKFNGATGATMAATHFEGHNLTTHANFGNHTPSGIAVDSAGNVAVVGSFTGNIEFGATTLVTAGGTDAFIAKLDPSLAPVFALRLGGTGADLGMDVAFNAAGELLVGGSQVGTSTGAAALTAPGSVSNAFLLKLDPAGATQFAASYGDTEAQAVTRVNVHGSAIVYGGVSAGTMDFGGGVTVTNDTLQGYLVFGSLE